MSRVTRLTLADFRSYAALDLHVDAPLVALTGENGAGKTNVLEALSLLAPGRGLRRADYAAMARAGGNGRFGIAATLSEGDGEARLGTGFEPDREGGGRPCRIDGAAVSSASAFADHLRLVWLTPDLDGLFRGAAGDRRRFLDRLVLAVDAGHSTRVNMLERALRSRNRLLDENGGRAWLDAVEREVAEAGIAVAAARAETVARLAALIRDKQEDGSPFPWADLHLEGEIDELIATRSALEAEDAFRDRLARGRDRDRAAGRTLLGPQASDLSVRHGPKDIAAAQASTGEQKALLVGLVLSHARLVASMSGLSPLVLLDEVAAHLDPHRRSALYGQLLGLGAQVWMTGADPALFGELPEGAALLHVRPGQIEPQPR